MHHDHSLVRFPLIPEEYVPHTFPYIPREVLRQLSEDGSTAPSLEDWTQIFYDSIPYFTKMASMDPNIEDENERLRKSETFQKTYTRMLDDMMEKMRGVHEKGVAAGQHSKVDHNDNTGDLNAYEDAKQSVIETYSSMGFTCLHLCQLRENALRQAGFKDPFVKIKYEENMKSLEILRDVLSELDTMVSSTGAKGICTNRWELIVRNMCAANIFDLGSAHTTKMYHDGGVLFHDTRDTLLPRPWVIDDVDLFCQHMTPDRYKKAILFVDNSGSDIILGMLPFARQLLLSSVAQEVVIAANSEPSINDITYQELDALVPKICEVDDTLCSLISSRKLRIVPSGNALPVIDLRQVSEELANEARDADFVVLEGMGRSIETNLYQDLLCDSMRIGMVKHKEVASCLQGRMLDCVVRFQQKNQDL